MHTAFLVFGLLLVSVPIWAQAPKTFNEAKRIARQLYAPQSIEFYCGCRYQGNRVNLAACSYVPRKNPARAARIEWEHIVPAWQIGHQRQCWQSGGRKNCARIDRAYQRAEANLHNLVPSIGEINADRGHLSFGWLPPQPPQYGSCPIQIDFAAKKVMPRPAIRGMIARTYLYMSKRYRLRLSRQDRQLYEAWHRAYPAQDWERQRNQRVACVMGHGNDYVAPVDLKACN
ncbi:endonuclease [Pseudomonas sp. dw_358]|uniref:endonuclease n=1 Tax=Pseudomonas sp. dw_358 TaxID=2720083 RepID=UPI001BD32B75|nr:endonuclease [Pseudomonas sp. dw_358]